MRAVSLPVSPVARNRKDSTPRHGRLLHPSSWAERDDRDHAAKNFFQGGSPKTGHPISPPGPPHRKKSFLTKFPGWDLDENLKPKKSPYRGAHCRGSAATARRPWRDVGAVEASQAPQRHHAGVTKPCERARTQSKPAGTDISAS